MKHMKRTLAILLTLVLLCTYVPVAFAEYVTIVDSGNCGDNLTWTLDSDGTLTISGIGDMWSYDYIFDIWPSDGDSSPKWWRFRDYFSQIESIYINEGVTSIGKLVFSDFCELTSVYIPDSVTNIGEDAFRSCNALTSISIPAHVTTIGGRAFSGCRLLTDVRIPDSVTSVGEGAFDGCINATIWISEQCSAPFDIYALTGTYNINVDSRNSYYSSVDGVLFNKDQTELVAYPGANQRTEYTVPESVKKICDYAFVGVPYLEKLVFPEGLLEIGEDGVYECCFCTEIVLPESLQKLGYGCFAQGIHSPHVFTLKSLNTVIENAAFCSEGRFKNVPEELQKDFYLAALGIIEPAEEIQAYLDNLDEYIEYPDNDFFYLSTIRCHAGSTAEAYAIEHGMDYELTHFFEGDWNYDWDNLVRWRKCIHCDERETEPLETETPGGAEIVGPADGDTSFDVEPVSTDYVLIKEALGEQNVVKAFDISLKNNDGVHVQPKGTVKVKLPGDFKTGDYKVYRVNADGTYTDMNAFREGSHLVFYTDHFSLYVVVDASAQTEPTTPDTPDTPDAPAKESKVRNILHTIFEFLQKLIRLLTQK